MKAFKISNLILFVGALLIALRLIFPVLACQFCTNDKILWFSFSAVDYYSIHTWRTLAQCAAIAVITAAGWVAFRE